ncbi:MAG: LLM class flavin-dependent oxidoreductase [Haloferacaceae archaeon]
MDYGYLLPTRGIVLTSDSSATLAAKTDADVVGAATRAEALGFDAVWVGDSVLAKPRLEPLTTLSAVAAGTDAVDLGTAVYLPTLRDPVHVAHQTATLDQVSGGRLSLGVGVGIGSDVAAEYANLDVPYGERGARMDELLDVVTRLWSGESVDFDGSFYQLDDASIGFAPARDPSIYVPSAAFDPADGFPRSIRERIAAHADGWLPLGIPPETYATGLDAVREFVADAGRDADAVDPAFYLDAVVGEKERAVQQAREFYDRYYPEWDTLSDEQVESRGAFGPPATVAETLDAYAEAGAENVIVRFTTTDQRTQLRRFADLADGI